MFTGIKTNGENRECAGTFVQIRHFILTLEFHAKPQKKRSFEFKKLTVDTSNFSKTIVSKLYNQL